MRNFLVLAMLVLASPSWACPLPGGPPGPCWSERGTGGTATYLVPGSDRKAQGILNPSAYPECQAPYGQSPACLDTKRAGCILNGLDWDSDHKLCRSMSSACWVERSKGTWTPCDFPDPGTVPTVLRAQHGNTILHLWQGGKICGPVSLHVDGTTVLELSDGVCIPATGWSDKNGRDVERPTGIIE